MPRVEREKMFVRPFHVSLRGLLLQPERAPVSHEPLTLFGEKLNERDSRVAKDGADLIDVSLVAGIAQIPNVGEDQPWTFTRRHLLEDTPPELAHQTSERRRAVGEKR